MFPHKSDQRLVISNKCEMPSQEILCEFGYSKNDPQRFTFNLGVVLFCTSEHP